jgi:hypothetical protein
MGPFGFAQFLFATAAPFLAGALLAWLVGWLPGLRRVEVGESRWCARTVGFAGILIALITAVCHALSAASLGTKLLPPTDGWHWLIYASAALAIVMTQAHAGAKVGPRLMVPFRWVVFALVAIFGCWLLLRPLAHALPGAAMPAWVVGSTAVLLVGAWLAHSGLQFRPRWPAQGAAALAMTFQAMVLGLMGSKDLALLAGIPACVIAGMLALDGLTRWLPGMAAARRPDADGLMPAAVLISGWYSLAGLHYAANDPLSDLAPFALAVAALPAAGIIGFLTPSLGPWRHRGAWLAVVTVLVIGGGAVALALAQQPAAPAGGAPY